MTQEEVRLIEELSWNEKGLPQKDRTRHVHGLHPYLGKYIHQLVDYFLDKYFNEGDKILDPFAGSGTTLVEANIHSMESVGVDISEFNVLLCRVKTDSYNLRLLKKEFSDIVQKVKERAKRNNAESRIDDYISDNPIAEVESKVDVKEATQYLRAWYHPTALYPLLVFRDLIPNYHYKDALKILLSRTARSSRLAPHFQLDFPSKPFTEDYECYKHARTCHPTTNAIGFLDRYEVDTYYRIAEFQTLRTRSDVELIHGDSREEDYPIVSGVITSPPYVGLIDYHEQHRYAYELLGLKDKSDKEIGAKKAKNGKKATEAYKNGISDVISRISERTSGPIIFVVNDKYNMYEEICRNIGVKIMERMKRRVDRRTGRRSSDQFFEDIIVIRSR
ncbi:MAG: DNA methyltransferase [Rhabdochlamydiaceae bacterium]